MLENDVLTISRYTCKAKTCQWAYNFLTVPVRTFTIKEADLGYANQQSGQRGNDGDNANYEMKNDNPNLCLTEDCVKAGWNLKVIPNFKSLIYMGCVSMI